MCLAGTIDDTKKKIMSAFTSTEKENTSKVE